MTKQQPIYPDPRFMKVAEIAKMLNVSRMTVYRLVHSGALRSARFGHLFRIPAAGVKEYIEQKRVK